MHSGRRWAPAVAKHVSPVRLRQGAVLKSRQGADPAGRSRWWTGPPEKSLTDIFCQMRIDGDRTIVAAMNVDRGQVAQGCGDSRAGQGQRYGMELPDVAAIHDSRAGRRTAMLEFDADFPPSGEHVYVIAAEQPAGIPAKPQYVQKQTQVCEGPFEYSLNEDNVCVLDMAKYRIDEGRWQDVREVLKIDQAVRDHFGLARRGGEMVQPWFSRKYWPLRR